MSEELERILGFVVEIEKLKNVLRKSRPIGMDRYENAGEHSWHVCLVALALRQYANHPVNIDRVIRMLLIHDLGEIDAGDVIVYHAATPENQAKEAAGASRIFSLLPEHLRNEFSALWTEFETAASDDARYARAIDRLPALLQNLHGDGHTWRKHGISAEQILALNSRINSGSTALWQHLEALLRDAFAGGLLTPRS